MTDITLLSNELRIGTWKLSTAFKREHYDVLKLIKKHSLLFSTFGDIRTRRMLQRAAGRPVDEIMLNNHQILFLMSILRASGDIASLKAKAIQAGSVLEILQAISEFDFDSSDVRYVYAASDDSGRVKIGISNNPERRLGELNTGNADTLRLVFVREASGVRYADETLMHKQYERYNIRSEWFTSEVMEKLKCQKESRVIRRAARTVRSAKQTNADRSITSRSTGHKKPRR